MGNHNFVCSQRALWILGIHFNPRHLFYYTLIAGLMALLFYTIYMYSPRNSRYPPTPHFRSKFSAFVGYTVNVSSTMEQMLFMLFLLRKLLCRTCMICIWFLLLQGCWYLLCSTAGMIFSLVCDESVKISKVNRQLYSGGIVLAWMMAVAQTWLYIYHFCYIWEYNNLF